jgi:Ca2+-binding RTX toxin-like protein
MLGVSAVVAALSASIPAATAAPIGNGFVVTAGDLDFILKQIKISERHSATLTPTNPCGTLVGPAVDQVPDTLTSYGLRTTDGSCNNLIPGREKFAAADTVFPRLTTPDFTSPPSPSPGFPVPSSATYKGGGNVVDTQPRVASNLIVDQTSTNPAAVAAAGNPVRTQNNPGVKPCTTDPDPTATPPTAGVPVDCIPSHQTLFIPNVTTDVGLSPPYNSLFTFFGQFFDHGVDQTVKSGSAVFVPLKADDPLIAGPDHILGNGDDLPVSQRFMVLTRAQNQPGPDGILGNADDVQDANNTDSPWVDQSQTYTSHSSHQVFLREYQKDAATGRPVSTGKLLGGLPAGQTYLNSPDGTDGIGTWAAVKKQAAELLGLKLVDADVTNIPMLAADPYGNFIPGPNGLPQYATATGLVEGNLTTPVAVPANVLHFDTPFLTDIAHNADPSPQDTDNNPNTPPVVPVPDGDNTTSADFAHQPAGTYDNELLDAHFSCGDGRCNENIALSSIHQIFHSEHDRLVGDITDTLNLPANAALKAAYQASHVDAGINGDKDMSFGFGGRLFQAARFVTEMEYQHLVFEEFARKVQPAVRPFHVYSPDVNPAIEAEFAHAVYRFGHSMLDDLVSRNTVDPTSGAVTADTSLPLLTAFLNPPMYFNTKADSLGNPSGSTYTAQQAAGAIIMGSSDQVGNELDEFVTETLRNNLLGLPLDLPTLNMARAREAGIPRLNDVRRQIFGQTNDGQLIPYTNWSDFGQHLKHPESLINYVAAYGTHPTITGATTLVAKRDAARAIVDPRPTPILATDPPADVPPADAAQFMFGTGAWADANGKTSTGLDDVDLWVGGLGEVTNLFGGLLGSTFNYVFQTQLEKLQDGDRLYYLARTPGMNLRTQLEGNSFSEMIGRNTGASTHSLKADAFATADCKFQLANLNGTAAAFATSGSIVADDPTTTDCNETKLLQRQPDGTIAYLQRNTVDPSGINGQSVYNGTDNVDRIKGGNDNDTFWGGKGNDVIDGQGGDDIALGGEGNDIITDLDGADVPKGGPGNDAIDAGPGNDIVMGNEGADFLNAGAGDNETFAGPGNDFIIAGQGADAVFGDGGDDWIQGGTGQDLLQGDHGAPFFDDPAETAPGNDFFIGQNGENDYDAEGGDDVMAQNSFVDRNAGAGGFDWAFHQYDTTAANDDMMINNNLGGLPIQLVVNRDRWQETEADSGGALNDTILGTDGVLATPRLVDGRTGGFSGCDALDAAGVARIKGLDALLPPTNQWLGTAAETSSLSAARRCPLTGPVWGEGDILLGGQGSDTITGRSGDEIIDGDKELTIAISVRTNAADPATEIGRTDLMENTVTDTSAGAAAGAKLFAGKTLQAAVFAGLVDPGNLVGVREIVNKETNPADCAAGTTAKNCDTAAFAGPRSQYTVTVNPNGSVKVVDTTTVTPAVAGVVSKGDGTDTLFNVEQLKFSDTTIAAPQLPAAPTITSVTPTANGGATVNFVPASGATGITGFTVTVLSTATPPVVVRTTTVASPGVQPRTFTLTGLPAGTFRFTVAMVTAAGTGPQAVSAPVPVTVAPPVAVPGTPSIGTATAGPGSASVTWVAPTTGGAPATYLVQARNGAGTVLGTVTVGGTLRTATVTGLAAGVNVTLRVSAVNSANVGGAFSANSNAVTTPNVPGAPVIGTAVAGAAAGAPINATVNWTPPATTGAPAVTGYRVTALQMSAAGAVLGTTVSAVQPATARTLVMTVPVAGNYRFTVQAINAAGASAQSARSNLVAAR